MKRRVSIFRCTKKAITSKIFKDRVEKNKTKRRSTMSSLPLTDDLAKLSFREESEAMKKFWKIPELVEKLFPFLDASSILNLARVHPPTHRILQGGFNWIQFLRRSCPSPAIDYENRPANLFTDCAWAIEAAELKKQEIRPIVQLLKMMKNPRPYLLDLLDLICHRFHGLGDRFGAAIEMTCPQHRSHTVDAVGFLLLEEVESSLGSTELKLEFLQISQMVEALTVAFGARVLRQEGEGVKTTIRAYNFFCTEQIQAEFLLTLAQRCKSLELVNVHVFGKIGAQGWSVLAEAISLLSEHLFGISVASRQVLLEANTEDLRTIWEAIPLGDGGGWSVQVDRDGEPEPGLIINKGIDIVTGLETDEEKFMEEEDPEKAWAVLEQYMNKS